MFVPLQGLGFKETNKTQIQIPYRPESLCTVSMATSTSTVSMATSTSTVSMATNTSTVSMATSIVPQCLGGIIALAFWVAIR